MWWHPLHTDRPAVLLLHPLVLQSWWDGCSDTVLMWHYPQSWWHWLLSHLSPSFHIQHCTRKFTSNFEFLHFYYNLRVREFPVSTCQIVYATDLQNAVSIQLSNRSSLFYLTVQYISCNILRENQNVWRWGFAVEHQKLQRFLPVDYPLGMRSQQRQACQCCRKSNCFW